MNEHLIKIDDIVTKAKAECLSSKESVRNVLFIALHNIECVLKEAKRQDDYERSKGGESHGLPNAAK